MKNRVLPEERRNKLMVLLLSKPLIRVIETHNGISGLVGENVFVEDEGNKKEFDALWISSLTDSVAKGYPDEEIVSIDSRLATVNQIMNVTTKPIMYDGDTGGFPEQLNYLVKQLERMGVSAIVIEDKKYPKSNSLLQGVYHNLEDKDIFAERIKYAQQSKRISDFMVIARIESLICSETIEQAIERAKTYLDAGADGIMIHSKSQSPELVLQFAELYNKLSFPYGRKPLMCVPTTYHSVKETELIKAGFNIVLYANHQLRAAYKSMNEVCKKILRYERASEAEEICSSIKEVLEPVGSTRTYTAEYKT
ncbi:phosphoenolpyruvate mutase [Candidatus Pacearchaeota archaeon]|nr:phosphoenolpyruvate mutase [Candidatus Pacearchaeota archaeon]